MIKAVGKRLIVKRIEDGKDEESASKKIIIQVSNNTPYKAEVIAIGSEVDEQVVEGNLVHLPFNIGTPIEIEGVKYLAVYEDQILAVEGK